VLPSDGDYVNNHDRLIFTVSSALAAIMVVMIL
jgi:hypothetical protein